MAAVADAQRAARAGAFWVFTSSPKHSAHVRSDQRLVVELGEGVEVAQLVLRGRAFL